MTKISLLDRQVADMIAAGEVVERPSSVIKELIENSVDAGATSVTVEVQGGGMSYIRVTDNGCGMSAEDAKTCFLRHATSKLHDARGLEAISTLGFRGEALAAISSVSRVELMTRERGADEGVCVTLDGGRDMSVTPAGCPEGTTVIIRNLFFNTPARLKFMKSDRAEGASCSATVLRCALSHPEISVRFIKDGAEQCHTPGDSRTDSCVYSVLGREFALDLKKTEGDSDGVRVHGFVSSPHSARGNRSYQFFFVNGRNVKSKILQTALEQAYKNVLFTGRYPACVLYIELSPATVDVNVHPTKTEVRFLYEKKVFDSVYYAVQNALGGDERRPELTIPEKKAENKEPVKTAPVQKSSGGFIKADSTNFMDILAANEEKHRSKAVAFRQNTGFQSFSEKEKKYEAPKQTVLPIPEAEKEAPVQTVLTVENTRETPDFRLIGEAMDTYIIVEKGDSLWLIDKHAAHERMHFDRLRASVSETVIQPLITPVICRVGRENAQLIAESAEILGKFGIAAELFGEDTVAVREIPDTLRISDVEPAISEICEKLSQGCTDDSERTDAILHTVACKAAIKSGMKNDPRELRAIAERVMSGEIKYCPHGRPVSIELTRAQLDRSFRRI